MAMPLFLHPADDVLVDGKQTASAFLARRLEANYTTQSPSNSGSDEDMY